EQIEPVTSFYQAGVDQIVTGNQCTGRVNSTIVLHSVPATALCSCFSYHASSLILARRLNGTPFHLTR
ncbi:hypothetical protein, partial [Pseudomonas amygdali]